VNHNKHPTSRPFPTPAKSPKTAVNPSNFYHVRPAWRVKHMQLVSPFGWHELDSAKLVAVREKLAHFESMTWGEILVTGKKLNHVVKVHRLCPTARGRLEEIFGAIDVDALVSLRLSAVERIWGILDNEVLQVLWWDSEHEVCPSLVRHT
jgi:hypothetical protein